LILSFQTKKEANILMKNRIYYYYKRYKDKKKLKSKEKKAEESTFNGRLLRTPKT
jgi:hypothetical protein